MGKSKWFRTTGKENCAFQKYMVNYSAILFRLRHALMTFGDKMTQAEVDDAYEQMVIDNQGRIDTGKLIAMLTASAEEEEGEGEAA